MKKFSKTPSKFLTLAILSFSFLSLAACSLLETPNTVEDTLSATVAVPTPADTPEPSVNEPAVNDSEEAAKEPSRALTVWVLPELDLDPDTPAGSILNQQLTDFDINHPEIELKVEHKSIIGQGSMIDYFSSASNVAPKILPDLILVPHNLLPTFAADGYVYPIEALVTQNDIDDLYPVGHDLTIINSERMGYPYAIGGLTHAAYNSAVYSTTLPSRLDQVLNTPLKPAFPASGKDGAQLLLQLYLDEGGRIYNEEGNLAFESTPLLVGLRRIQALRANGSISDDVGELSNHEEMWLDFKSGNSSLILTNNGRFVAELQETADLSYGQFPGSIGGLDPMVEGWIWAVSTADPARQALAAELLTWMANGANMGDWTYTSQMLPVRQSALERWPEDDYSSFLDTELDRATVKPELLSSNVGNILQGAMQDLFATTDPPVVTIAENAVKAINEN